MADFSLYRVPITSSLDLPGAALTPSCPNSAHAAVRRGHRQPLARRAVDQVTARRRLLPAHPGSECPLLHQNICEHCPTSRTDSGFSPCSGATRRRVLAADAEERGYAGEASRHRQLVEVSTR
jgi:hypothetical protein